MKIYRDERGLFIKDSTGGGHHHRPGPVAGYSHVYDMSDGGLKEGDNPKTSYVSSTPLIRIKLPDGKEVYWMRRSA